MNNYCEQHTHEIFKMQWDFIKDFMEDEDTHVFIKGTLSRAFCQIISLLMDQYNELADTQDGEYFEATNLCGFKFLRNAIQQTEKLINEAILREKERVAI